MPSGKSTYRGFKLHYWNDGEKDPNAKIFKLIKEKMEEEDKLSFSEILLISITVIVGLSLIVFIVTCIKSSIDKHRANVAFKKK